MATKKALVPKGDDLVYTDQVKHHRAKGIFELLKGGLPQAQLKADYSSPGAIDDLVAKFRAILAEAEVDLKDEIKAILFIYKKLGGGVTTYAKQEKIKAAMRKVADSKAAAEGAEDPDEPKDEDEEPMDKDDEE